MSFFEELKRRNVVRVGAAYLVVAWLLMQVTVTFVPALQLSDSISTVVAIVIIAGFPIALILAWVFELTPEGLQREGGEEAVDHSKPESRRLARKIDLLIIAVLTVAVMFFVLDRFVLFEDSAFRNQSGSSEIRKSVAVLPFENLSEDETNNPFTNGIHDDLLTQLSRISSIKTISRTSVLQYKGTNKTIFEIAQELGVANILEGGVQRSGDRVRITAQLIDASSDEHIWAETYDRQLTTANIFAIQTEIASAIASALRATLSPREQRVLAVVPTRNLAAYEAYQLGKQTLDKRTTKSAAQAIEFFNRATELDQNFAQAWAGLASGYRVMATLSSRNIEELEGKADHAIDQALRLNDQLSEIQTTLADIRLGENDLTGARKAAERALQLNPNDAEAQFTYGKILHESGNPEEALVAYEKAIRLDPLSRIIIDTYAFTLAEVGRVDEALSYYKKLDAIDPHYPGAAESIGTIYGMVYGRLDLANLWYRKALALDGGNNWLMTLLALVFLELDDDETAEFWINRALQQAPGESWANGAMTMLSSYRGDRVNLRKYADIVTAIDPRWRFGTALAHDRVPVIKEENYDEILDRYRASFPELFKETPIINGANYRSATDVAGLVLLSGDRERAGALLAGSEQQIAQKIRVGYFGFWVTDVQILALQGKAGEALTALRQAVDQGWRIDWRYFFYLDPNLDSIRQEPEFQAILLKVKEDMAQQLERTREMEANGELMPIPALDS